MKAHAVMFSAPLAMAILWGCSGKDGEAVPKPCKEPNARHEGMAEFRPVGGNGPLPPTAVTLQQSNNVSAFSRESALEVEVPQRPKWRFERLGRYIENTATVRDFRLDASLETVSKVADEIEHDILAADVKRRTSGMFEYLVLAVHFGDCQYGREVDGQTWRVIREKESFEVWSNRVAVSHAFLRRMLEFGRKNNFTDDAGVSAERYCMAVKELRRFSDSGQPEYVAVLKPCVEMLGDELDRDDSVLKKGYDYYRSFCPTDEDAKPMLKEIIRKMGRRPKWAHE